MTAIPNAGATLCVDLHADPQTGECDIDALADALSAHGACRIVGWPAPDLRTALREDLRRLQADGALAPASVGRGAGRDLRRDIRADATLWLDDLRCGEAARDFLARMDALRIALNRRLFLGLDECEAHYAAYPPGGGYARHRDRFRDSDARVVSLVSYLNDDWGDADGGALRLHADDGGHVDIAPLGASVCFLSEREHEVLPAHRDRFSIAAWFRRNAGPGLR
jgi:SM-20-related protein